MSLMKERFKNQGVSWCVSLEVVKQMVVTQSERKAIFIDCKYDLVGFEPLHVASQLNHLQGQQISSAKFSDPCPKPSAASIACHLPALRGSAFFCCVTVIFFFPFKVVCTLRGWKLFLLVSRFFFAWHFACAKSKLLTQTATRFNDFKAQSKWQQVKVRKPFISCSYILWSLQ